MYLAMSVSSFMTPPTVTNQLSITFGGYKHPSDGPLERFVYLTPDLRK
jgi:hypothetical protein